MSVFQDILEWSADRPKWQRDALRRIITQPQLQDSDEEELLKICLEQQGIIDEENRAPDLAPLSEEHLPPDSTSSEKVQLIGIKNVSGVNAIAEGQNLSFIPDGVTIVFGYNGSGKSGYARIIKSVSHSRDQNIKIYPNAFSDSQPITPSAKIRFQFEDENREYGWDDESNVPKELRQISFFDADCASVHVNKTNELAFTPFGLDILPKLVTACQSLSESISGMIDENESTKPISLLNPESEPDTEVRRLIDGITGDSDFESFSILSELSAAEESRLRELQELFKIDHRTRARELRNTKNRLNKLKQLTAYVADALSEVAINSIHSLHSELVEKRQTASIVAERAFSSQPIQGVGNDVWRELWGYARKFSTEIAYPEKDFPFIGEDAHCVLCQQMLDNNAKQRFQSFEDFVKGEAQKAADEAQVRLDSAMQNLEDLSTGRDEISEYIVDIIDEHSELCRKIRRFHGVAWRIKRRIRISCDSREWSHPLSLPENPSTDIGELISSLSQRIDELERTANDGFPTAIIKERNELAARKWLSSVLDEVRFEIGRKQVVAKLNEAKRTTQTTWITRKSSQLTQQYITEGVVNKFSDELSSLGARYLQLEFAPQGGQEGSVRFKVDLKGAVHDMPVQNVLSEGELRCIAIAAFLTELSTEKSHSALVFDDPVSSLDHYFRRKVAERLISEAQSRQVIVFTHDVVFFQELSSLCESSNTAIRHCYVKRGALNPGECIDGKPWQTMKVNDRIAFIRDFNQEAGAKFRREEYSAYEPMARKIYGLLRESWERAVEEVLLNSVVMRFQREVHTQQIRKIYDISDQDFQTIHGGMTKCSRFLEGHDEPMSSMDSVPDPDEIEIDVLSLKNWVREVRDRRR